MISRNMGSRILNRGLSSWGSRLGPGRRLVLALVGGAVVAGIGAVRPTAAWAITALPEVIVNPPGPRSETSLPLSQKDTRWQQVYDNTFFGATPLKFDSLAFFAPYADTIVYPDFEIRLSTTVREPGGLSTQFAANIGANETVVFDGPISLTSAAFQWLEMTFTTPFTYDPSAGNLLVEISHGPSSTPIYLPMICYEPRPAGLQRVGAADFLPPGSGPFTHGLASGFGELATRFGVVPEPGSAGLGIMAIAGLVGHGRRRRRLMST
jgi:hypothetical protein